jgi:hypothetical protein
MAAFEAWSRKECTVVPTITIVVSVDWEGISLLDRNLDQIRNFRSRHPHIPFQHFLNAAYFTKAPARSAWTTEFIRQTISDGDELGVHVHAWQSLVQASNVKFRTNPSYVDREVQVPKTLDSWSYFPAEPGYDVPLEAYETREIAAIVRTSRNILADRDFIISPSFRAGGWMSGSNVQAALRSIDFRYDCSAVSPQLVVNQFGDIPLSRWLLKLWPAIEETSQPFRLLTGDGDMWVVPNNAGLIDYTPVEAFRMIAKKTLELCEQDNRDMLVVTGFHQETAELFLSRLEEALSAFEEMAAPSSVTLHYAAKMAQIIGAID